MKRFLSLFLIFLIGIAPAYLLLFNFIFSDSNGSAWERIVTFLLAAVVYGIMGLIIGYLMPRGWISGGVSLVLPALIILILYTIKDFRFGLLGLSFLYLVVSVLFSLLGSYVGGRFGIKKYFKY